MLVIHIHYQLRDHNAQLVDHAQDVQLHRALCEVIDDYPWDSELKLTQEHSEGGGFHFQLGESAEKHAVYQLIPVEPDRALLNLEIILNRGFLHLFGRKAAYKDFDIVSISEAKHQLKELFSHSVEGLYQKYK